MEKRTAHYNLAAVKAAVALSGVACFTQSARDGMTAMGLAAADALAAVAALERQHLYKSMTTLGDHTVWQDVYHSSTQAGDVYLKLTVIDDVLIVSFKEL